jgi:luciferase family oxidoreductase group 1
VSRLKDIPFSVLDLAPVGEGFEPADALRNSLDLARHAERLGYKRFWVAEHHSMPGIASAATSVVIGYIAGGTSKIRVGAGGVMLSNHAPLVIAEQFGTLESLYPGRIDLGLGRAPGTDPLTMRALRRRLEAEDEFPEQLQELRFFLQEAKPGQKLRAVPGAGTNVPIWLLGSSGFSAQLAGELGLPFAFAGHFSPDNILPAMELYRRTFRPSETLKKPHAMLAINVVAAESDAEAWKLASSQFQSFLALIRGRPGKIQPPVESMDDIWNEQEKAAVDSRLGGSVIGSPATVAKGLEKMISEAAPDELMINAMIYDHAARVRSYEIVAEIRESGLARTPVTAVQGKERYETKQTAGS